jgi:uroporphyrinogen-III synthase
MGDVPLVNAQTRCVESEPAEGFDVALLGKIARRISVAAPIDRVLTEVVECVAGLLRCDSCSVYLLEGEELVLRASKNPHPGLIERLKLSLAQEIAGWTPEHREALVVPRRAYEDRRCKCFTEPPQDQFEAFLSMPMFSGGHLVGVINVQNRFPYLFSRREISLAAILVFMGGAEVDRARLENENSILSAQLDSRKIIERAKGILQRDLRVDEKNAYRVLQRESQQRRKSMKEIAEAILLAENLKRPRSSHTRPVSEVRG